jgi:hypothetical protein
MNVHPQEYKQVKSDDNFEHTSLENLDLFFKDSVSINNNNNRFYYPSLDKKYNGFTFKKYLHIVHC